MTANGRRRRDPGPARPRDRASSDGPIHPNRDGYAAGVPATTPAGAKARGYADGATRENVDGKRVTLHPQAAAAPVPTLAQYLTRWLADAVAPNLEPATYAYYETMARLYIIPALGAKRLDQLQTRDVADWLTTLATICQCCTLGKDAARPADRRRCCAIGACCAEHAGRRTLQAARNTLRSALNHAIATGELVSRNAAAFAKVPRPPKHRRKGPVWSVAEASRFLASAREDDDPLYAAYVLILVNGLRKGEVLGLTWSSADLAGEELETGWQLQRAGRHLIHKRGQAGDPGTVNTVPLPGICAAALRLRRDEQEAARQQAGGRWRESGLVFTTRWGTPVEPRNFNRSFDARCTKAGVTRIRVHDTRHTCAPILAALDVHPQLAARILRHARITTTADICSDDPGTVTREALKKLGASLSGLPPAHQDLP